MTKTGGNFSFFKHKLQDLSSMKLKIIPENVYYVKVVLWTFQKMMI
jgi:hypothetical protein